jgi:osmoprotectant transport system ATP-binding protein
LIKLENISKSFDRTTVLQKIDLSISAAHTTVFIGPSGCGKSTLIRIIIGLIQPDSGKVYFNDKALTPSSIKELRKNIGYVIQEGGLFPHLTAFQNIALSAQYFHWNKTDINKRVEELAKLTKIPYEILTRYPLQLSGGQRQRISLMRSLMLDPQLLLLDEPLGALDPMIRYELQTDLKQIFTTLKKTVIMVTHDLNEARYFGDTIILIKEGSVVQQGRMQDFLENPVEDFVLQFIRAQRGLGDTKGF